MLSNYLETRHHVGVVVVTDGVAPAVGLLLCRCMFTTHAAV